MLQVVVTLNKDGRQGGRGLEVARMDFQFVSRDGGMSETDRIFVACRVEYIWYYFSLQE